MNTFESLFKPLMRSMALLLAALLAECGGGGNGGGSLFARATAAEVDGVVDGHHEARHGVVRPTVVLSSPSNSATNVPTSTNGSNNVVTGTAVTATFGQPMDPATISSSPAGTLVTFRLKETTGNNVPGTVTMNAANTVATFTPTAPALSPNASYTATVR